MKTNQKQRSTWPMRLLAGFFCLNMSVMTIPVSALPSGETVVHGDVTFTRNGSSLTVTQGSRVAIVNYDHFGILSGETVRFDQPGEAARILNRVIGGSSSEIAGALLANGQVYLINPNGILFTRSATVNVGGLVASAMDMANDDFINGRLLFHGPGGSVINEGTIRADHVYLIGRDVRNAGQIVSPDVILAEGKHSIEIDRIAGGQIRLIIDGMETTPGRRSSRSNTPIDDAPTNQVSSSSSNSQTTDTELPTGASVQAGSVSISTSGDTMTVNQTSDRAIVEYQSFNIGEDAAVRFNQPDSAAAILNRILGGGSSRIAGEMTANGRVYLINPNGVVFTPTARVNVGGLVATTTDIPNDLFMAGLDRYTTGIITVQNSASEDPNGADASNENEQAAQNASAQTLAAAIIQAGRITASSIYLDADTIEHTGVTEALNADGSGGFVELYARDTLTVHHESVVSAGGATALVGGDIRLVGDVINLLGGYVDASGLYGGGRVLVGGDFRGQGDFPTASHTYVGPDFLLRADALLEGDGGTVVYWADDTMAYGGQTFARPAGNGQGGFVEISGREQLGFYGQVNTGGGTLLLDPRNVEITSGAPALGFSAIDPANIVAALVANHVIIHTHDNVETDNGDIRVTNALEYDSPHALSLLATRHIEVNASIQNSGVGALTLVAGWDEATGFTPGAGPQETGSLNLAALLSNPTSYGNNNGSVFIGDGTQSSGIAVGSRFGPTTVLARDLTLTAGTADYDRYAQLGFRANTNVSNFGIDAPISLFLRGDLTLAAGAVLQGHYAQIGHGAFFTTTQTGHIYAGDIIADIAGNLTVNGGAGNINYAQIGHGGFGAVGNHGGDMVLDVGGDVAFTGGSDDGTYAQLGHGGREASGDHSGDIALDAGGDITFSGGIGAVAYAQLGHGGSQASGDQDGVITVDAGGDVTFTGGSGLLSFAHLGHGGDNSTGDRSGSITLDAGGDVVFSGGGNAAYARIGHGGYVSTGSHNGYIVLNSGGDILFSGGGGTSSYAQVGHGAPYSPGSHTGDITVEAATNVVFSGGAGILSYAQLGHGGFFSPGDHSGSISLDAGGDLVFTGSGGFVAYAQLGHGGSGSFTPGSHSGDLRVGVLGDILFSGGSQRRSYAQMGHGGFNTIGNHTGDLTVDGGGDVVFAGGAGESSFAQLGHGGVGVFGNHSGSITLDAGGDVVFSGGAGSVSYAQLGHGGAFSGGTNSGDIIVGVGGNLVIAGGAGSTTIAQFGHGGYFTSGDYNGDLTITVGGDAGLTAGSALGVSVQLGHGGVGAAGDFSGDIVLVAASNVVFTGGGALYTSASIGHGGTSSDGDRSGSITLDAGGDVVFIGGAGFASYTQLGHGGAFSGGTNSGDILVNADGRVMFTGGVGSFAYTQLGHGGVGLAGDFSGDITVTAIENLTFTAGAGDSAYAHLGHGGDFFYEGNRSGDITVEAGGDVTFSAGGGEDAYAQLGHGGISAAGDHSGDITVEAGGDVTFSAGGGEDTYAQLGHGGRWTDSTNNLTGQIDVQVGGDLSLIAGAGTLAYVQFGHGGYLFDQAEIAGTREGDITLVVVGETTLADHTDPSNRRTWHIGHLTSTPNAISDAEVFFSTGTLGYDPNVTALDVVLNQTFADRFTSNFEGGNITVVATAGELLNAGNWAYDSANRFTLMAANDSIRINGHINNTGDGLIRLEADDAITQNGGIITGTELLMLAATGIGQPGASAMQIDVDVLAFETSGGSAYISDAGNLIIGTVDGVEGASAPNGHVKVEAAGHLTVTNAVTAGQDVLLLAQGGNAELNATVTAGRHVSIVAQDEILQNLNIFAGVTDDAGTIDVEAFDGSITMATGTESTTQGGNIRYAAGEDVLLSHLNAGTGSVSIVAGQDILNTMGLDTNVVASALRLEAGGSAGMELDPLIVDVSILAAIAGGDLYVTGPAGMVLGTVGPLSVNRVNLDSTLTPVTDAVLSSVSPGGDGLILAGDVILYPFPIPPSPPVILLPQPTLSTLPTLQDDEVGPDLRDRRILRELLFALSTPDLSPRQSVFMPPYFVHVDMDWVQPSALGLLDYILWGRLRIIGDPALPPQADQDIIILGGRAAAPSDDG